MGLDTTHGCWHGGYHSFNWWRTELASVAHGINLDDMVGFGGSVAWDSVASDPIVKLLNHSDCDGQIDAQDCKPLADRLSELLPLLSGIRGGHIGDIKEKTQTFIDGLMCAHEAGEPVLFK